jgi:putative hydrolase of the HAD superfamily
MRRRAVLFDVGGPIDTETAWETLMDRLLRAEAEAVTGQPVTDDAYRAAWALAVASHAPNAYQAVLWQLLGADEAKASLAWGRVAAAAGKERGKPEIRPGIAPLLMALQAQGIRLALAANQPAAMLGALAEAGLLHLFAVHGLSGVMDLRKPDPRFFLHITEALGRPPEECVMVGDRIDNDIAPARALGMATIRLRTGRHATQRPRTWLEAPDAEVDDLPSLRAALAALLRGPNG